MTAHEHHTHPETNEPYCCCGYGYPDPITSREPTDGLPTWREIERRDPVVLSAERRDRVRTRHPWPVR